MNTLSSIALLPGLVCVAAVGVTPLSAQANRWSGEAEVGANVFFGNTQQTTLTTLLAGERADSILEFDGALRFNYGEAGDGSGDTFVNKRTWFASLSADWKPQSTVTPFVFASWERSLERRIDRRLSGGAGAKYAIVRDGNDRLDVSLAVLAERTTPRVRDGSDPDDIVVRRWSARFRHRTASADGRLSINTVTWYRPELTRIGNYTFDFETTLGIGLTESIQFRITFIDRYDSSARDRGARRNNDGQISIGIGKTF